jgi:hypothetical protein
MAFWGIFFGALLIGIGIAAIAAAVMVRMLIQQNHARVLRLERELALIRANEHDKQQRLNEIFLAVTGMHRSTEERLSNIRARIEQYFAVLSENGIHSPSAANN